jgi:hypothetical protein
MASKKLEDLDPRFRPLAEQLIANARLAKLDPVVVETRRTEEEHKRNLAKGVSWTKRSKHIDGLAIDIAPLELLKEKAWAPHSPLWITLGNIGEALGLRWGGRWKQRDMCHFEYVEKP